MNAKELKRKMDREVDIRKLLAKLDRENSGVQLTINKLFSAVHDDTTSSCTIELTDIVQEEEEMEQSGFEPPICFVCNEELFPHNGEIIFRVDGRAHMECLWNTAKLVVSGEMELINAEDE
jgi:hypothetical protein